MNSTKSNGRAFYPVLLLLVLLQVNAFSQEIIDMENGFKVGYYMIQATHSGKFLNVNDASMNDNAAIVQFQNNNSYNEHFAVLPVVKEAGRQYYMIMARHSGKYFNVQNASMNDEARIHQYRKVMDPKTNKIADHELFWFKKVGDKTYEVRAKHSGKNWNIKSASMDDRAYLQQYNVNGTGDEFRFILVEEINIPNPPATKEYDYGQPKHKMHTMPTETIHTMTNVAHLPFYLVDDPIAGNPIVENPYYILTRDDYWKATDYGDCPESTNAGLECTLSLSEGKSWSETKSKEFSNTTGISVSVEAGGEIDGLGVKTTVTASTSFTFTQGLSHTAESNTSSSTTIKVPAGNSAVIWQLYSVFTLKRISGETLNSWSTYLPGTKTSILSCDEVPCQ